MKKLERFLQKYSWQLKLGIVLLLIVWMPQTYKLVPIMREQNQLEESMRPKIAIDRDTVNAKFSALFSRLIPAAQKTGWNYGPNQYFADLTEVEELKAQLGSGPILIGSGVIDLNCVFTENLRAGIYNGKQIDEAREKMYVKLRAEHINSPYLPSPLDPAGGKKLKSWALQTYWRGFFLALLLYLVQMSQGRGILKTILASKFDFAGAVLLWPFFLTKYPEDKIREIVVEAELRRLGRPFRRLSEAEKKLVRRIAASAGYREWRIDFQRENQGRFQRSFRTALIVTLFVCFFIPTLLAPIRSEAGNKTRAGPAMVYQTGAHHADISADSSMESFALPEKFTFCELPRENAFTDFFEVLVKKVFAKDIEHVPVIRLFGFGYSNTPTTR